ncbi:hypothetical protein [Polyangium jinanense]|uniref:Uncharacterized protein n=1 Tax=Polyangium jinanense TaxID=2829994 RepID=A0A9X3XEG9_9BACT|nr:hypothetical protein [Polyangium jinanense]MDC3988692.1 hypothetical protein [Polyangium jinanense]
MNYIRILAVSLAVSVASPALGHMSVADSTEAVSEPSLGEAVSEIREYIVRTGPGFNFAVAYRLPGSVTFSIECTTYDTLGNQWYRLTDGNYIVAAHVVNPGNPPAC